MTKDEAQPEKYLKRGFLNTLLLLDNMAEEEIPRMASWEARRAVSKGSEESISFGKLLCLSFMEYIITLVLSAFFLFLLLPFLALFDLLICIIFIKCILTSFNRRIHDEKS